MQCNSVCPQISLLFATKSHNSKIGLKIKILVFLTSKTKSNFKKIHKVTKYKLYYIYCVVEPPADNNHKFQIKCDNKLTKPWAKRLLMQPQKNYQTYSPESSSKKYFI